jgi:hypothetical protein
MIFSFAVSFESKKKKIPDLSLPPCTYVTVCVFGGGRGNLLVDLQSMGCSFQLAKNDSKNLMFSFCTMLYMQKEV